MFHSPVSVPPSAMREDKVDFLGDHPDHECIGLAVEPGNLIKRMPGSIGYRHVDQAQASEQRHERVAPPFGDDYP